MPETIPQTILRTVLTGGKAFQKRQEGAADLTQKIREKQIMQMLGLEKKPRTVEEEIDIARSKFEFKEKTREGRRERKAKEKLPSKRASKMAKIQIADQFLAVQMAQFQKEESLLDRKTPFWSKYEIVRDFFGAKKRFKSRTEVFKEIGKTEKDIYEFGKINFPEQTLIAFPAKRKLIGAR